MFSADLSSIFGGLLKLVLLGGAVLYASRVLMHYRSEGSHLRPQVDWRDPAHMAERWAVWLGVGALTLAVRVAAPVFGMLSEASADVGEWFLDDRHRESH